ncbi:hypothetical protein CRYUN_Cryun01aG0069300 [Craigia yunnanensis]
MMDYFVYVILSILAYLYGILPRENLDLPDIPGDRHHAVYRMSTESWRVLKGGDVDFFEDLYLCNNHNNACVSGVITGWPPSFFNILRQNWTKLLRIGPLSGVERMYGFWNKNGNKVYVESVSGQLLVYDLDIQDFRDIGIKTRRALYLLEVHIFEESLIATSRDQIK